MGSVRGMSPRGIIGIRGPNFGQGALLLGLHRTADRLQD